MARILGTQTMREDDCKAGDAEKEKLLV